jgi:SEL1 protein
LVNEALELLHGLEPKSPRMARFSKPSGFLGTTVYYAKETFVFLFMNNPVRQAASSSPSSSSSSTLDGQRQPLKLGQPLRKAVALLERAAEEGNADALYVLGDMNFYGNFSYPRNYTEAFRRYNTLAALSGNSSAQHMVGFMYATGIGGAVAVDAARALLYYTHAALAGDTRAEMALAFRYHAGIGTARSCEDAVVFYRRAAAKAIAYWRSGPPGGRALRRLGYRLADDAGGVYGEGASASSAGENAVQGGPTSDSHAAFDDVLEYLDLMSRKGDLKATFTLGRLHYEGSRALQWEPRKARAYFMQVAKKHWAPNGKVISAGSSSSNGGGGSGGGSGGAPDIEELAAKAAGYLGRMYLRGEGVEQNFERARMWFKRGEAYGEPVSQTGLGMLYLAGHGGVPRDALKAAERFRAAAEQDHAPAQVHLGTLYLDQGDVRAAAHYFDLAARHGHIEAFYYLAELAERGAAAGAGGRERSCATAKAYYKAVAERAEAVHSPFAAAQRAYAGGDVETAFALNLLAAEQGYEVGQANVAYLLDEQKAWLRLRWPLSLSLPLPLPAPFFFGSRGSQHHRHRLPAALRDARLALMHWTRSAKQANVDSMVKLGDYYLAGVGAVADAEKAASCYQAAAEFQQSAQALWNLGWMYENGIGLEQDFHLAKRYYDLALEVNQEAYLPVQLSLIKLRLRSFWNRLTNGRVNSIQDEPGKG